MPTLHYARKAALLSGCDVLSLTYGVPTSLLDFSEDNIYKTLIEECFLAISKVTVSAYEKIIFISKSIGNLIAIDVDRLYFNSLVTHVFYTPVETFIEKIPAQNCVVFTGDRDKFFRAESVAKLKALSHVTVYSYPHAVHSLEVNDDIAESLNILGDVTKKLESYILEAL